MSSRLVWERGQTVVVEKPIIGQLVKEKVMTEVGINFFVGAPREVQSQSCHTSRQEKENGEETDYYGTVHILALAVGLPISLQILHMS